MQGDSYAIPTKNASLRSLSLSAIKWHVDEFRQFARMNAERAFEVTPIGCGLAGYSPVDIAPMFDNMPPNVKLPQEFLDVLRAPEGLQNAK